MNLTDSWIGAAFVNLIYLMLLAAMLLAFVRLVYGKAAPDRVVALDLISAVVVAFTALYAVVTDQPELIDVAIGIALITFLGTIAFARYIERRARDDEE